MKKQTNKHPSGTMNAKKRNGLDAYPKTKKPKSKNNGSTKINNAWREYLAK